MPAMAVYAVSIEIGSHSQASHVAGIGLGIALAYLRQGDKVVLTSRNIKVSSLQDSKEEVSRYVSSKQAFLLQKDVTRVSCMSCDTWKRVSCCQPALQLCALIAM